MPSAVVAARDAALSNLLIKAVIRPNPWLRNELLSEPGVPASGRRKFPYSFAGSFLNLHTFVLLCDIVHIMSNG